MSDYNDIAKRNPQGAVAVISSFGYEIVDRSNLGQSLNELVAQEGEPALRKVMDIHPDKDVILELFGQMPVTEKSCGCSSCKNKHNDKHEHYMNMTGSEKVNDSNSVTLTHQTNVILLVSALFIATALIIKTQK
jgi:hypothetical protein